MSKIMYLLLKWLPILEIYDEIMIDDLTVTIQI